MSWGRCGECRKAFGGPYGSKAPISRSGLIAQVGSSRLKLGLSPLQWTSAFSLRIDSQAQVNPYGGEDFGGDSVMSNSGWQKWKLGDLFQIKHGYAFKGKYFSDSGQYILLTPGNFYEEGGFKLKKPEKYYIGEVPKDFILSRGDLLVAMTEQGAGLLGSPAIIPESNLYLHNQRLGLVTNLRKDSIDKKFLYYLFNYSHVRDRISASAGGMKVRHTSPSRIYEVEVSLPSVTTQRKIAAVLSAYDDLIENNTRRIQILEEMAQTIYREWFVHFRFPGHENVKMVESKLETIPEGWEVERLGDIVENVRETLKPGPHLEPLPYVPIDCIPRRSLALAETKPSSEAKSSLIAFKKKDILFGAMRSYFHKVILAPFDGITRQTCFVLRSKIPENYPFDLFTLFEDSTIEYSSNHSTGSTIPYASWEGAFAEMPIVKPPQYLIEKFSQLVRPTLDLIEGLTKRNANLRRTRDLLLPKLISGEIDVSELDITAD